MRRFDEDNEQMSDEYADASDAASAWDAASRAGGFGPLCDRVEMTTVENGSWVRWRMHRDGEGGWTVESSRDCDPPRTRKKRTHQREIPALPAELEVAS